jgi:myb proto-oncogene protein
MDPETASANPHRSDLRADPAARQRLHKQQFSVEEDRALIALVRAHGLRSWSRLAKQMSNRTPKQCRERWHNHLDPGLNRGPWSPCEDRILALKHRELGNRWADIARFLPGRSDTLVKNRWHSSVRGRLDDIEGFRTARAPEASPVLLSWSSPLMLDFTRIPPLNERI